MFLSYLDTLLVWNLVDGRWPTFQFALSSGHSCSLETRSIESWAKILEVARYLVLSRAELQIFVRCSSARAVFNGEWKVGLLLFIAFLLAMSKSDTIALFLLQEKCLVRVA